MMGKYAWLEKRKIRVVDQLRLWTDNPRLDPEEKHLNLADYVSDLIADPGEKDSFFKLLSAISSDGFIPSDPVVVWKNPDNKRYYVAEGNRRVLVLKLLRNPNKAPLSIRRKIRIKAEEISRNEIEKIPVCVAPSFEDCEWYINQRHATSSIQRGWSRHQQQRWIAELYDKYNGNVNKVMSITKFNKGQLEYILRILKIRDFALVPFVLNKLSSEDKEKIKSHRIPMTIIERWFTNAVVKEKWGLKFEEDNVVIISNEKSFLIAYTAFIKLIMHKDDPDVEIQVNTRTIDSKLNEILEKLPKVSFESDDEDLSDENNGNEHYIIDFNGNNSDYYNELAYETIPEDNS